jgi:hypothetical protein
MPLGRTSGTRPLELDDARLQLLIRRYRTRRMLERRAALRRATGAAWAVAAAAPGR